MKMPNIIYGTAWKKERTSELVQKAIQAGFRGIDTAGQPKHYNEKGVGDALKAILSQNLNREDIFLQTKFTPLPGHDPTRIPYDPEQPLSIQVAQSFENSKKNLNVDYVDSYVLHSPLPRWEQLLEVWEAMEAIQIRGEAKILGISNCYHLDVLVALHEQAKVKPKVVQNRFYQQTSYDAELREWCRENDLIYQSFWSLTANPHVLNHSDFRAIADRLGRTEAQVFFRFLSQKGIVPLTGTSSEDHMREDLQITQFDLSAEDMRLVEGFL